MALTPGLWMADRLRRVQRVGESNVAEVKEYIASQDAHHRTRTFQEEFIAMLAKHGIAYDERYIWK